MKRTTDTDVMTFTECKESKQCAPAKHHYDECVERVTSQESDGGAKEDCVEECKSISEQIYCVLEIGEEWPRCARLPTTPSPMLTAHNAQSSTSPTAQRRAPRPSCGPSSDKPIASQQAHRTGGSGPGLPARLVRPRERHRVFTIALVMT